MLMDLKEVSISDFIMSVEFEDDHVVSNSDSGKSFYPSLTFELSDEQQTAIIEEYIFDLTGKKVDLNKIEEYSHGCLIFAIGRIEYSQLIDDKRRHYSAMIKLLPWLASLIPGMM